MDDKAGIKTFNLRLPTEMVDVVDARARKRKISRNEWFELMTKWIFEHIPPDKDEEWTKLRS